MGFGTKAVDFIRGIFGREVRAREDAAAGADIGDLPIDMFGNVAVQAMGYGLQQDYTVLDNALMSRFIDYERMSEFPDIASALKIYSDEATVQDYQRKHVVWVDCKDLDIQEDLNTMLHTSQRRESRS